MSKLIFQHLEKYRHTAIFFLPSLLVLVFNLGFFNRSFPLSEGWWETYGYLVNKGLVPYKNFNLEFTPVFVFFNAFLLQLTHSFFLLRLWGVILMVVNTLLIQCIFEKFYDRRSVVVGALAAIFLFMTDSVYIAKDYQTYLVFLICLVLISGIYLQSSFATLTTKHEKPQRDMFYFSVLLGFLLGLVCVIKQNVGIFLFFAYFISCTLELRHVSIKATIVALFGLCLGLASIFLIFFTYFRSHAVYFGTLAGLFVKNDSKGDIFVVLARVFFDDFNRKILFISLVGVFILCYTATHFNRLLLIIKNLYETVVGKIVFLLSILLGVFIVVRHPWVVNYFIALPLAIFGFLFYMTYFSTYSFQYKKLRSILLPLFALIYCNTQVASFNSTGLIFINVLAFSCLAHFLMNQLSVASAYLYGALTILVFFAFFQKWVIFTYDWWGLHQGSVFSAKYSLPYPETKGLHVDKATQHAYAFISDNVRKYSQSDNDVYFFPNIPVFYYLEKKRPPYSNVVQWFDVISSAHIQKEFDEFKANLPNVVVFLEPPNFVYQGHEALIHRDIVQLKFRDELRRLVLSGEYIVKTFIYNQSLGANINFDYKNRTFVLENNLLSGKSLAFLFQLLSKDVPTFRMYGLEKQHLYFKNFSLKTIVNKGDRVMLQLPDSSLNAATAILGYEDSGEYYLIRIYIKKELFDKKNQLKK